MSVPFRIGVLQLSMEPVEETIAMAQACEAAGFDTFWLAEAYHWWRKHSMEARSSTSITALAARETSSIGIGWGIISPYTRHPAQIAMEARVLQETAGKGRFLLGLGASKIFMKHIGEGESGVRIGPATVMREAVEVIRGILSGGDFSYQGKVFSADVPAMRDDTHSPNWDSPLYFGATGPVLQRMSGAITDGLLTASITTPGFAQFSRTRMEEGALKAGRDPDNLDLGCVVVGSINENSDAGKQGAREMAAMYLANKVQNIRGSADIILEKAGLTFDEIAPIAEAMEQGGRQAAGRAVSDETLEKVCPIAGTPEECIRAIQSYRDAGCTHILLEIWGDDRLEQVKLFGEAVLPHFQD